MSSENVEASIRGPKAYQLSHNAVTALEARRVWPTPINFELWLHLLADPHGELAREIERLLHETDDLTDIMSESLAIRFLPRHRASSEIRSAGDELARQLEAIARAIEAAQKSNGSYSQTLTAALNELEAPSDASAVAKLVSQLSDATRRVKNENNGLERRLSDSTQEIRRLHEHLEQVRRESLTDALTGLPNRKAFEEALARACDDGHGGDDAILTLAIVDIDHFKRFNDTWGHQTGDQVLRYVASVLAKTGARPRMAARHGGEEFAILFPGESAAKAGTALDAMLTEIASRQLKRRSTNDDLGAVTVSAGYAQRRPGEPTNLLLERADTALYASKREGRNRTTNADFAAQHALGAVSALRHPGGAA